MYFFCGDLRPGDDLLPAKMSPSFLREVLAFRSRSTMNFFVLGCPAGDSNLPRLRPLPLIGCLRPGDPLTSGEPFVTFGDLLIIFGDLLVTFGDLNTSVDLLSNSDVLSEPLQFDAPFVSPRGRRCVTELGVCVTDCSTSCSMLPLTFSEPGLIVYCSLLAADDGKRADDFGLCLLADFLADDERLALLTGDDF